MGYCRPHTWIGILDPAFTFNDVDLWPLSHCMDVFLEHVKLSSQDKFPVSIRGEVIFRIMCESEVSNISLVSFSAYVLVLFSCICT